MRCRNLVTLSACLCLISMQVHAQEAAQHEMCFSFNGLAGNAFSSPIDLGNFKFEWGDSQIGNVIETSSLGGDYLRKFGDITVKTPFAVNQIALTVLSEGGSTTHDLEFVASDGAGKQVGERSLHVAAMQSETVVLQAPGIVTVVMSGAGGEPVNETGIQKVCTLVLVPPA